MQSDLNFHQRTVAAAEEGEDFPFFLSFTTIKNKYVTVSLKTVHWTISCKNILLAENWQLLHQFDRIIKTSMTIISTSMVLFIHGYQSTSQKQVQLPQFLKLSSKKNPKSELFPCGNFQQLHHRLS